MINKIGFACILSEVDPKKGIISVPDHNFKTTTISWLNRQSKDVAVEKLWELLKHNIQSAKNLVGYVGKLNEHLRMVRLGSDMLPAYTHDDWKWFWKSDDVRSYCERGLAKVGELAREKGVRLSFHPGQFCCLASDNPSVVDNSIEEFEYHADMARWMGYGREFQDFKINVHISGRAGPAGIRAALKRLTPEARNCITIENDEITWGVDSSLELVNDCALVLDIHHHFIHTGEYISPTDDRFKRITDSWKGVRPVIHYSVSRENLLVGHCANTLPNLDSLLEAGFKKSKLRAHSDFYWNKAVNQWAMKFSDYADIMCESKSKNLASFQLYESFLVDK
jgi:UV DNA damage repair endonuclease